MADFNSLTIYIYAAWFLRRASPTNRTNLFLCFLFLWWNWSRSGNIFLRYTSDSNLRNGDMLAKDWNMVIIASNNFSFPIRLVDCGLVRWNIINGGFTKSCSWNTSAASSWRPTPKRLLWVTSKAGEGSILSIWSSWKNILEISGKSLNSGAHLGDSIRIDFLKMCSTTKTHHMYMKCFNVWLFHQ